MNLRQTTQLCKELATVAMAPEMESRLPPGCSDRVRKFLAAPVDAEQSELLDDIESYLDDRMDIVDGEHGPLPNGAMALYTRLTEARSRGVL